jgi:predicted secreted acid phosphatase
VLNDAKEWVHERASKVKRPAIVLDIDETSLSNWEEIAANDFAYVANPAVGCAYPPKMPCDGVSWERLAKAKAIPQTLALFEEALKLKVAIFFITGRLDDAEGKERTATELNLNNEGYQGFVKVFLRPDRNGTIEAYKSGKRAEIESDGFTIIANVGDQYSDLRGGHSEKAFKVPNPFYLIP